MSITRKEKELAAVGISIAAGCRPCTDFHIKAVREAKAGEAAIRQAVEQAAALRRAATDIMRIHGLAHLGGEAVAPAAPAAADRQAVLTALGVAYAVNCTSSLEQYIVAARETDIGAEDIVEIAKLAHFIKGKGASHVERLIEVLHERPELQPADPCCDG